GRLLVALNPHAFPEPRQLLGQTAMNAPPVLGRDADGLATGRTYTLDRTSAYYPLSDLDHLKPGEYNVQAVLIGNRDLWLPGAPGNMYSDVKKVRLDPADDQAIKLELTNVIPSEEVPEDTEYVKHVKFKSELLSKFHGRTMYLRAGVVLPRDFNRE